MSVLIKGMKMPKSCILEHGLTCEHFAHCNVADAKYKAINARPKDCPLVEVPTPHGDLIDREEVEEQVEVMHKVNGLDRGLMDVALAYDIAPTVIEAEEQR